MGCPTVDSRAYSNGADDNGDISNQGERAREGVDIGTTEEAFRGTGEVILTAMVTPK